MKKEEDITIEDVKHFEELHLALNKADKDFINGKTGELEVFSDTKYLMDVILPKGLSDEDKFLSSLILLDSTDIGLTTKRLSACFGWTKYKCYKLARQCKFCKTVPLIHEMGGYAGTGWILSPGMHYSHKTLEQKLQSNFLNN